MPISDTQILDRECVDSLDLVCKITDENSDSADSSTAICKLDVPWRCLQPQLDIISVLISVSIVDLDDNAPILENLYVLDFVINENRWLYQDLNYIYGQGDYIFNIHSSDKSGSDFEPTHLSQFPIIMSDPDDVDPTQMMWIHT